MRVSQLAFMVAASAVAVVAAPAPADYGNYGEYGAYGREFYDTYLHKQVANNHNRI